MKKHRFTIELEFEDKISTDNEISEICINILNTLVHATNTSGLVPDDSETFTRKITVENDIINTKIEKELC